MKDNQTLYKAALTAAIVSSVFTLFVTFQLAADHAATRNLDPANVKIIEDLRSDLRSRPTDEQIKEEIRTRDMLVRRTYFTSLEFSRIGALLLLFGAIVMIASFKILTNITAPPPCPGTPDQKDESINEAAISRNSITAGLFLFIALVTIVTLNQKSAVIEDGEEPVQTESDFDPQQAWPNFRGPFGQANAFFTDVPSSWDGASGKNILWKSLIPRSGQSSPVVVDEKVFVTGSDEAAREVYCYDAKSGMLLWTGAEGVVPGYPGELPDIPEDTGFSAPTMATDGSRVFAIFATGNVVCFNMEGKRLWSRYMGEMDNTYGYAASLIAHSGKLFIQYDHSNRSEIYALDSRTGDISWKTVRTEMEPSWSSPILADVSGRMQLVVSGNPHVKGYDPETGEELWTVKCMRGELASSPAYADGIVYVANEYATLAAIRPGPPPETIWEFGEDLPDVSSPAASKEYLIIATGTATLSCFDAKSGKRLWLQEFEDGFYSSPVIVGKHVYVMDNEGVTHIVETSDTYKALGACALGEQTGSTPAFYKDRIYIRSKENLYCISEKQ